MKKLIAILLCVTMLLGVLCLCGCHTQNTDETGASGETQPPETDGDFEYLEQDGASVLVGYNGTEETLKLPEKLGGKPVIAIGEGAFSGKLGLSTVIVPEGVTDLGDYAFESCSELAEVMLPSSLRTVGKGAFSGCVSLETVKLSEGIESFGDGAFFYCRSLKSFTVPASVKSLGDYLFAECGALQTLELKEGVTEVSDRMCWKCMSLQSVVLPESLTAVGARAFARCENLRDIVLPDGVSEVGEEAFAECGSITKMKFSASVLRNRTFAGCYSLEELILTSSVREIEPFGLARLTVAGDLYIPGSIEKIGTGAFYGINTTGYVVDETSLNFTAVDGVLMNRAQTKLISYPGMSERTAYTIPDTVDTIAGYAFSGVYLLEELTIPASVTTLEDYALYELCNLPELTIPASVTSIGAYAFSHVTAQTLRLESPVETLPEGAFFGCGSESILLPDTLKTIPEGSLVGCGSLMEFEIPASVETIEDGALTGISCPIRSASPNFKTEGDALYTADGKTLLHFNGTVEQTELVIPEGVERIADYAVSSRWLTSVTVPDTVTQIGEYGLGYVFDVQDPYIQKTPVTITEISASKGSAAAAYAEGNVLACFEGEPVLNITELTLAGDETAELTVENAAIPVFYSSFDSDIVSVSENGVITAHKAGTADVFASVGPRLFKCTVTVTSDGTPNPDAFDAGKYRALAKDEVAAWMENYLAFNKDNILLDHELNAYSAAYKGENYFEGIWAAQVDESEYDAGAIDMFGSDFRPQLALMGHGLAAELDRFKQPDDLVLYSGTTDFGRFLEGGKFTMQALKDSIGTTVTEPFFLSTALQESVTPTFAGPYCCVFIIYADKEAVDGGYIEATVGQGDGGEYEILLKGGARMEVLDAGMREIYVTDEWTGEVNTVNETYMKVRLLVPEG